MRFCFWLEQDLSYQHRVGLTACRCGRTMCGLIHSYSL